MGKTIDLLSLTLLLGLFCGGCTGMHQPRPEGRRLAPCPASPNCVSSQSSDPDHAVEPLAYNGTASSALDGLRQILRGMKRARIVSDRDGYLHAEFSCALFRFVDEGVFPQPILCRG